MDVEFIQCNLDLSQDNLHKFLEQYNTNYFFLLVEREEKSYSHNYFIEDKTIKKREIRNCKVYPNLIIFGNDVYYPKYYENIKIVGVCPLKFKDKKDFKIMI